MNSQEKCLHAIILQGGICNVNLKGILPIYDSIVLLKAVPFDEQAPDDLYGDYEEDPDKWPWNIYVNRIRSAIGVKTYCSWIRNDSSQVVGIIAAYDKYGTEVKLKYFEDVDANWETLLKVIADEESYERRSRKAGSDSYKN